MFNRPRVPRIKVEYPKNIAHSIEHTRDKFSIKFRRSGVYSRITRGNAFLYGINQFFGKRNSLTIRK